MDLAFCPDEWPGGFVVVGDESLDMGDEFWNALERGSVERLSREDRDQISTWLSQEACVGVKWKCTFL